MAQQIVWPPSSASISGTIPVSGTVVVSNVIGGTVAVNTGTIASITNIAGGTITIQNSASGTLDVVERDRTLISSFGVGTGTVATFVSDGMATCGFGLNGTWSGTITVSASVDAVNYSAINAINVSTGAASSTITTSGQYVIPSAGMQKIRLIGVLASGTCSVDARANQGAGFVYTSGNGTVAVSTIAGGTVTITPSGTQSVSGSVVIAPVSGTVNIANGTVTTTSSGGNVGISTGTIASVTNIVGGTIAVNTGTIATIASVTNVAAGTLAISTGTIASITNVAGGTITVSSLRSTAGALTSVGGSSAAAVTILANNASRKNAAFFNNSTGTCYMSLGSVATTALFTVAIPPNGYYELPVSFPFSGSITGIWSAANGTMTITEFT